MVIDTSAVLAVLQNEPERRAFNEVIEAAEQRSMSTATFVESSIVIESRYGADGLRDLDLFIAKADIELVPVDVEQADAARRAFSEYGRGRHPAGLNFGDCFSYALAKLRCWECRCSSRVTTLSGPTSRPSSRIRRDAPSRPLPLPPGSERRATSGRQIGAPYVGCAARGARRVRGADSAARKGDQGRGRAGRSRASPSRIGSGHCLCVKGPARSRSPDGGAPG